LLLFAADATIEHARTRVETHYHHGRDAGNFGRWLGARSDVIYTGHERRATTPAVKKGRVPSGCGENRDRVRRKARPYPR
jgi:hypothetical protein